MTHAHGSPLPLLVGGIIFTAFGLFVVGAVIFEAVSAARKHREATVGSRFIASIGWLAAVCGYGMMGAAFLASSFYHPGIDANSNSLAMSLLSLILVGLALIWVAPNLGSRSLALKATEPPDAR